MIQNYDEKVIEHKGLWHNKITMIIIFKVEPQYLNEKQLEILNGIILKIELVGLK